MWFEALKSFNVIPGSLGDLAIVTWFWPQNRPFLTPPCPREKDGRGQSGPNSCFPIDSFHLRRSRVSTLIPGSLGDPAIVTWFWPQNQPFFTPPAHGRRMAGVKEALNYVFHFPNSDNFSAKVIHYIFFISTEGALRLPMPTQWLPGDNSMTICDYPTTTWLLSDDYLMTIRGLFDDYHKLLIYFSWWSLI